MTTNEKKALLQQRYNKIRASKDVQKKGGVIRKLERQLRNM